MRILIADGEPTRIAGLSGALRARHEMIECQERDSLIADLKANPVDLVITADHQTVSTVHAVSPGTSVIFVADSGEAVVESLHRGADDYLLQPVTAELLERRTRGIEELRLQKGLLRGKGLALVASVSHEGDHRAERQPKQLNPETFHLADVQNRGLTELIDEIEARLIMEAMERTGHNQVRAADLLKITRGTLQYKLKKYNYQPPVRLHKVA